jgi:hypothetical protein
MAVTQPVPCKRDGERMSDVAQRASALPEQAIIPGDLSKTYSMSR